MAFSARVKVLGLNALLVRGKSTHKHTQPVVKSENSASGKTGKTANKELEMEMPLQLEKRWRWSGSLWRLPFPLNRPKRSFNPGSFNSASPSAFLARSVIGFGHACLPIMRHFNVKVKVDS